jgi:hypothetical protein
VIEIHPLKGGVEGAELFEEDTDGRWLPDLVGSRTASWHILVIDRTESQRERELVLGGERTNEPPTPANAPFKLGP